MTYDFRCAVCAHVFDVVKSVSEMDTLESCPKCEEPAARIFIPRSLLFSGTAVQNPEYNPGLGCIVRNKSHRKELCRQKGLEEIGNEKPDTVHKHFDKKREERWEKSWADVDKGWVGSDG